MPLFPLDFRELHLVPKYDTHVISGLVQDSYSSALTLGLAQSCVKPVMLSLHEKSDYPADNLSRVHYSFCMRSECCLLTGP